LVLGIIFFLFLSYYPLLTTNYQLVEASTIKPPIINLGLVGHWTFDGNKVVNGAILDSSTSGNSGSPVNIATSTFYTRGQVGQAVTFDGSSNYINLGRPTALTNLVSSNFTMSLWFKVNGMTVGNRPCMFGWGYDNTVVGFDFGFNNWGSGPAEGTGQLGFVTYTNGGFPSGAYSTTDYNLSANQNKWVHAVVTWDGADYKMYIDGVDQTNAYGTQTQGILNSGSNIAIGAKFHPTIQSYFDGSVDDVRAYSRVLTLPEITRLYNIGRSIKVATTQSTGSVANGLIGHWTLDGKNITNGRIDDASGTGNHGNVFNIASSTFYTRGVLGQAGNFDGTNDYINKNNPYASSIFGTTGFTVSAWAQLPLNLNNAATYTVACGMSSAANTNCAAGGLYIVDGAAYNQVNFVVYDGAYKTAQNSGASALVPDSTVWHHYVGVVDKANSLLRIYVDGVELTTTSYNPAGSFLNPALFDIGRKPTPASYLKGQMDDVRIYNRTLTTAEITRLYALGSPSRVDTTQSTGSLSSGLVGHWSFDGKNIVNGAAIDSSGSGHNGYPTNIATTTFYTIGKIGQGVYFDGTNDYVSVADVASLNPTNVSMAAWVKTSTAGGYIIAKDATVGPSAPGTATGSFGYGDGNNIKVDDSAYVISDSSLSSMDLYLVVGGVQEWNVRSVTIPAIEGYVSAGGSSDLWNTTLTPAQVNASNFGIMIYDGSSMSMEISSFGFSVPVGSTIDGVLAEVKGVMAYNNGPGFDTPNLNYARVTVYYTEPGKTNVPYAMSTTNGGQFLIKNGATTYTVDSSVSVNDGNWHHMASTYDGTTMRVYVDGVQTGSGTSFSGNLPTEAGNVRIGADYNITPSGFFRGSMDDVYVYNRALTASEVQKLYNLGR
jgi:hypothetical protein